MASPRQLVKSVAEAFGVSVETVTVIDRIIADEGLRTKGGRGRSAARMTARDGAALLYSVAAAPLRGALIKETATMARIFSNLPAAVAVVNLSEDGKSVKKTVLPDTRWWLGGIPLRPLLDLGAKHTASDALSAIISTWLSDVEAHSGCIFEILVTVSEPAPDVEICILGKTIDGSEFSETHIYSVGKKENIIDVNTGQLRHYSWRYPIKLNFTQSRTFNFDAIGLVIDCLRDGVSEVADA